MPMLSLSMAILILMYILKGLPEALTIVLQRQLSWVGQVKNSKHKAIPGDLVWGSTSAWWNQWYAHRHKQWFADEH